MWELIIFRDESLRSSWLYVLVMLGIGAVYFATLVARKGLDGHTMPDLASIDAELDDEPMT